MDGKRWWLIGVATVLAALMVAQSIGWLWGAILSVSIATGAVAYRAYRQRNPEKGPVLYCLKCGQTLKATARQCDSCGSASWSWKN
jgi:hypothetical protein